MGLRLSCNTFCVKYTWSIYLFIFFFARIIFSSKKRSAINVFYRSSRIFRSFPIIFKPRLPFSPDWVRVFVSRPSSSSFLSYLQTSKKKERSARVGRKEYVRNFFSEITYGTNKRSGMRANKSCVSFTLRMKRKYLYKGKCISDAIRSLRVISMFRSLPKKGKTCILDNKIKLYNLALVEIRFRWKSGIRYAIFDTLSIILSWSFSYFRVKRKHRGVS